MTFRVLLVDDSTFVRRIVSDIVCGIQGVVVCGEASNGREGLRLTEELRPDLVIMDIDMPVMDGLAALAAMKERQLSVPVIILSAATQHSARATFLALELGALDFVPKPSPESGLSLADIGDFLVIRIRYLMLAAAEGAPEEKPARAQAIDRITRADLLVLASSTGGPQALHGVFPQIPPDFPVPIVLIQHMPAYFTGPFADRLDAISKLHVREARDGMEFSRGDVVVAPGGQHLLIARAPSGFVARISDSPPVHSHKPSIDVTLESVVDTVGGKAAAVIMTGMGRDGVAGMLRLHQAGGLTIAQDQATSVIFGMNRRAIEAGAIDRIVSLENLVEVLAECLGSSGGKPNGAGS